MVENDIERHSKRYSEKTKASIQDTITLIIPPDFPHELLPEILLRLPVKSLLKFKCVSKSWLSLISSHQFIKAQLSCSTSTANLGVIILSRIKWHYHLKHCSLSSLLYEKENAYATNIDSPIIESHYFHVSSLIDGCNGLICISNGEKDLFLWNPATRKSKKLPDLGIQLENDDYYLAYGFGYDEFNDDYEIVAIVCILDDEGDPSRNEVKVYSMKTDSWRRIREFPGGVPWESCGIFVNRKIHWSLDKEDCGSIVFLDLATEAYGEVEEPKYEGSQSILGNFSGNLCLLCKRDICYTDVWVLKEYEAKESWIKVLSFRINDPGRFFMCKLVYISRNGYVLVKLGSKLVMYNLKDDSITDHPINNLIKFCDTCVYGQSLVSPYQKQEGQEN